MYPRLPEARPDDLLLQEPKTLCQIERGNHLIVDPHQLGAGGVDGVELVEQVAAGRDVPEDTDDRDHAAPAAGRFRGG